MLAAGAILSMVALCLVKAWAVFDRMSFDLVLRQKAAFALNGEMERLWKVYTSTNYALNDHTGNYGAAIPGLPNSNTRVSYESTTVTSSFVTNSATTFNPAPTSAQNVLDASASMVFLGSTLPAGSGTPPQNWVWLDQQRLLVARLSWTLCPITRPNKDLQPCWGMPINTAPAPNPPANIITFACADWNGATGWTAPGALGASVPCELMIAVLEYPYAFNNGTPQAVGATRTLTLSTIVGRRI